MPQNHTDPQPAKTPTTTKLPKPQRYKIILTKCTHHVHIYIYTYTYNLSYYIHTSTNYINQNTIQNIYIIKQIIYILHTVTN